MDNEVSKQARTAARLEKATGLYSGTWDNCVIAEHVWTRARFTWKVTPSGRVHLRATRTLLVPDDQWENQESLDVDYDPKTDRISVSEDALLGAMWHLLQSRETERRYMRTYERALGLLARSITELREERSNAAWTDLFTKSTDDRLRMLRNEAYTILVYAMKPWPWSYKPFKGRNRAEVLEERLLEERRLAERG